MKEFASIVTIDKLEKILFEIICLMIILVMLHGMIQGTILFGPSILSYVQMVISIVIGIMFYLSRFKNYFEKLRIPLVLFTNVCLVFFWFWLSGYNGPTGIGAAAIGIISIILLPVKHRSWYLSLNFAVLAALVLIQINTDWVITNVADYATLPYDYLVILFGLLLIVNYLKNEFDKERKRAIQQNQELIFLNESLEEAIKGKQETIKTLQSTQNKLIDSEKMASVGRLTAGLAHELNNPLNFIGGNVQPILEDLKEIKASIDSETALKVESHFEEIKQLLDNVYDGSKRATDIINNLLKLSPRGSNNEKSLILINEQLERTAHLLKSANAKIDISVEVNNPVYITGNAVEINQVILNILKNAIDAVSPIRGKIEMKLYKKNDYGVIEISDNGKGVPEEYQSQIFEPFFTTKEEGKGTGLGLYISYGIVKKHEGELTYTRLNKGSVFRISLPLTSLDSSI